LFDGLEEDDDDGDVIGRPVVFGQLDKFLTDKVEIIWKREKKWIKWEINFGFVLTG
jgi:hypothetical protein